MDFSRLPQYPGDGVSPSGRRREPDSAGGFQEPPVTADATRLLTDCLDALDWLFDRMWSPAQVAAVLSAARETYRGTAHFDPLDGAVAALQPIVRSGAGADVRRERAPAVTDDLRHYLAGLPENRVLPEPRRAPPNPSLAPDRAGGT